MALFHLLDFSERRAGPAREGPQSGCEGALEWSNRRGIWNVTPGGGISAPAAGLTSQEAEERLAEFGPNDPAPARPRSGVIELVLLFVNHLVVILLTAAVISGFLGELADAGIIVAIVVVSIAINFVQTYRSQAAIEHLRARVAPTATVLRDGQWREIHRREVVPGDVVRLSAGDLVPADASA